MVRSCVNASWIFFWLVMASIPTISGAGVYPQSDDARIQKNIEKADAMFAKEHGKSWYPMAGEIAEEIVQKYPPSEFVYVGVGRSPTPVTAYLKEAYPGSAVNVPFSRPSQTNVVTKEELQARVRALFDRFLKNEGVLKQGKKILLIDFSYHGQSLNMVNQFLNWYLKDQGQEQLKGYALAMVGASDVKNIERIQRMPSGRNMKIFHLNHERKWGFFSSQYDPWAEYPSLDITDRSLSIESIKKNPRYELLRQEFGKIHAEKLANPCKSALKDVFK
jgi:hypothetical protein